MPGQASNTSLSVVIGVHNEANDVEATLVSTGVLNRPDAEIVLVDDGSTDETLERAQRVGRGGGRLALLKAEHQGLTRALIAGCAAAQGEFIARQDARDRSLPGRMARQLEALRGAPGAAFATCGVRFVGPAGEHLYDWIPDLKVVQNALRNGDSGSIHGPWHGSVMFRRSAYEAVGGYRPAFYFAQDLDLWTRLIERGELLVVPEILYEARIDLRSVTSMNRARQARLRGYIVECRNARRSGKPEVALLAQASEIRHRDGGSGGRLRRASALYFIGSVLSDRGAPEAEGYLRRAVRENPLHLKAWWRLGACLRSAAAAH